MSARLGSQTRPGSPVSSLARAAASAPPGALAAPLFAARSLRVGYGDTVALDGVDVAVRAGEKLAIVGESGSGKSTLALAALGLLPTSARILGGELELAGENVTRASERALRRLRGRHVGLVPQDPTVSLNPTLRIGPQVAEAVRRSGVRDRGGVLEGVHRALLDAGLDAPELRARQFPHELSGGMRQRVLIAIALAGSPRLLVADEPTSALDVTVQRRILDELERVVDEHGLGLVLITHDIGVATDRADRLVVLRHGRVVEEGATSALLRAPSAEYTRELLLAAPGREVPSPRPDASAPELLRLSGVRKRFRLPGGGVQSALDGVDLAVRAGQTTALVGESGSGKSTLLRVALGLERSDAGEVRFAGELFGQGAGGVRALRRRVQLVQQSPWSSLDPRWPIERSIAEPLRSFGVGDRAARAARVRELAELVALPTALLSRRPAELSGGQRQRVAIARALAIKPELLLLDEPVSALDVSVQEQVLLLLERLQRELGVAYLFVSHDLGVVRRLAHEVVVLRRGEVVESGPAERVFAAPASEYTRELLEAVPGHAHARALAAFTR